VELVRIVAVDHQRVAFVGEPAQLSGARSRPVRVGLAAEQRALGEAIG
jgi:hypothetical protein